MNSTNMDGWVIIISKHFYLFKKANNYVGAMRMGEGFVYYLLLSYQCFGLADHVGSFLNIQDENIELLKFLAFNSPFAAKCEGRSDAAENQSAIKCSHMKTYSCDLLLAESYEEANNFEK